MLIRLSRILGRKQAGYLTQPSASYQPVAITDARTLAEELRPGDVLLVEGNLRISTAIKYLTQSTWSRAALYYVGDALGGATEHPDSPLLVEADLVRGMEAVPLSKYANFHTRICRPAGLDSEDRERVINAVASRIGQAYDLKNVIDLARYLLPIPPVPTRWRRRLIRLGSGEPTRAICSTLIVQAFLSVRYPILPFNDRRPSGDPGCNDCVAEILHIRHRSFFDPFQVVKPSVDGGFDYKALTWEVGAAA